MLVGRSSLLILLVSCACCLQLASFTELEGFAEDDASEPAVDLASGSPYQEAIPGGQQDQQLGQQEQRIQQQDEPQTAPPAAAKVSRQAPVQQRQEHFYWDALAVLALLAYVVNIFIGKSRNAKLAAKWVDTFATGDHSIFARNFSLLGPSAGPSAPDKLLTPEGFSSFSLYASGRRYCASATATLNLRARQDALAALRYFVSPREDLLHVELVMSEGVMPPLVLAVASPKLCRALAKEYKEVKALCKQISVPADKLPSWPAARLQVLTEQASVFYDLFSEPAVGKALAQPGVQRLFRSLVFSSENTDSPHKGVLRFTFALPPAGRMAELAPLLALAFMLTDLVGAYKMAPELRKRAADARSKLAEAAFKDESEARQEVLFAKKQEKLKAEKERIARMGPEARAKYEERQVKLQHKKSQRKTTVRVG